MTERQRGLQALIALAPVANRQFHEIDLRRLIGTTTYDARLKELAQTFSCTEFVGKLALHGMAVKSGEIVP